MESIKTLANSFVLAATASAYNWVNGDLFEEELFDGRIETGSLDGTASLVGRDRFVHGGRLIAHTKCIRSELAW
jgi:hypothetical protein